VEIEGPSMKMIRESATQLKLDWEARVHSSYLQLFYGLRRRLNSTIPHATFRDFEGLREIHPEDLRLEYALPSNPS
jgi:hypothetical protein